MGMNSKTRRRLSTRVCRTIDNVIRMKIGYVIVIVFMVGSNDLLSSVLDAVAHHVRRRFGASRRGLARNIGSDGAAIAEQLENDQPSPT